MRTKSKLKGHKQKFSERWPDHELKSTIPILMSTPAAGRIKRLAADIRREHRTRRKEQHA